MGGEGQVFTLGYSNPSKALSLAADAVLNLLSVKEPVVGSLFLGHSSLLKPQSAFQCKVQRSPNWHDRHMSEPSSPAGEGGIKDKGVHLMKELASAIVR